MAFWRMVSRFSLAYLLFFIFLIYQSTDDARLLLKYIDPSLGLRLDKEVHTYDDDCDFTFKNLWDNFDHYYLIHCFNWFLGSFICRDLYFLLFW